MSYPRDEADLGACLLLQTKIEQLVGGARAYTDVEYAAASSLYRAIYHLADPVAGPNPHPRFNRRHSVTELLCR